MSTGSAREAEMIQSFNLFPFPGPVNQQIDAGPSTLQDIPAEHVVLRPAMRMVFQSEPTSPGADRIRNLRMRLRQFGEAGKLKSLLITSPLVHDGKSTIALNLATALAEGGKHKVVLVEGDFYHPALLSHLGIPARSEGLAHCVANGSNPLSATIRLEPLGWYMLPAGKVCANPAELLQTKSLSSIMQRLSTDFEWILIDSPPVLPLTDTLSLKQHADASLMVVRAGSTPKDAIDEALMLLGPQHVLGIVLNGVEGLSRQYYRSGYQSR
jgi:capsular exopolysaccharide synthesis family protein